MKKMKIIKINKSVYSILASDKCYGNKAGNGMRKCQRWYVVLNRVVRRLGKNIFQIYTVYKTHIYTIYYTKDLKHRNRKKYTRQMLPKM